MLSLEDWRAERLAALTAPAGWLNLTDRVDLAQGRQSVGNAAGQAVRLSLGPGHLGTLVLTGVDAVLEVGDVAMPFLPQPGGGPQLRHLGMILEIHTASGHPALRVRVVDHPGRMAFAGLAHFPDDPAWVIPARWEALDQPLQENIAMKGGAGEILAVTHRAVFTHAGHDMTLTAAHWKAGKPMFVIRDATSGRETYAASRFLIGEDAGGGRITLDFNRAHNPPCAFTDLAICPLPPPGNLLPFAVRAGELAPV